LLRKRRIGGETGYLTGCETEHIFHAGGYKLHPGADGSAKSGGAQREAFSPQTGQLPKPFPPGPERISAVQVEAQQTSYIERDGLQEGIFLRANTGPHNPRQVRGENWKAPR
jgi:hypothetical protein